MQENGWILKKQGRNLEYDKEWFLFADLMANKIENSPAMGGGLSCIYFKISFCV